MANGCRNGSDSRSSSRTVRGRRQYRNGGGRARPRRRLYAAACRFGERDQRDALRQSQFQFHPRHRAGRKHHARAASSSWSIRRFLPRRFPSSSPMPRPIRQGQHGVGRQRARHASCRRAVQDDDRRRHGSRALSRCGTGADRSDRRTGQHLRATSRVDRIYQGRQAARAGGDDCGALDVLPDIPTVGEFVPGYEASAWFGIGAPKNTPAEIIDKLNKEINEASPIPRMKARLATWAASCLRDTRRIRQAHRRRYREVGQGDPGSQH